MEAYGLDAYCAEAQNAYDTEFQSVFRGGPINGARTAAFAQLNLWPVVSMGPSWLKSYYRTYPQSKPNGDLLPRSDEAAV